MKSNPGLEKTGAATHVTFCLKELFAEEPEQVALVAQELCLLELLVAVV